MFVVSRLPCEMFGQKELCLAVFFCAVLLQPYGCEPGFEIDCIPIKLCPMAVDLIKNKPYDPSTIAFLRLAHCGYREKSAMVWCTRFRYCKTPDSKPGTCTNIKECDTYLQLLNSVDVSNPIVKKYLKEFRCNTEFDPQIKVCCPEEKLVTDADVDPWFPWHPFRRPDHHHRHLHDRFFVSLPNPRRQECGRQSSDNKIFGGSETDLDEFPWMALFKYVYKGRVKFGCAGSLISERYVVTAAHCVDPEVTTRKEVGDLFGVILGEYDTRNETDCIYEKYGKDCADPPQEFGIDDIITHPEYNSTQMVNDIALIRLNRDVTFSNYIHPICLPAKNKKMNGNETFIISGWGRTPFVKQSPVKLKASVRNVAKQNCNTLAKRILSEKQICAGQGKGKGNCYGDSGGPLILEEQMDQNSIYFLVGVISYGFGQLCGAFPEVNTYVPPYIDWISDVVGSR